MMMSGASELKMEIGVDSFAAILPDPATGKIPSPTDRMANLLEEVRVADRVGLDVFGVGEHHRPEFLDAAPAIILAAAAARTQTIRLTSAVTVLSAADPVRVFQEFATLDLIAKGRAEIVVGRGSFNEAYPLFGLQRADYDALFAEKLDLFLKLREQTHLRWSGRYRPPLTGQGVYPRPHQDQLPVWLGVGGTPGSFVRAGALGLPLMNRHHRRRVSPLSAAGRPLLRGRPSGRTCAGPAQGRGPCDGLRRRDQRRSQGRLLPGLAIYVYADRPRARLVAGDPVAV